LLKEKVDNMNYVDLFPQFEVVVTMIVGYFVVYRPKARVVEVFEVILAFCLSFVAIYSKEDEKYLLERQA
jgi:hypothetical protein